MENLIWQSLHTSSLCAATKTFFKQSSPPSRAGLMPASQTIYFINWLEEISSCVILFKGSHMQQMEYIVINGPEYN